MPGDPAHIGRAPVDISRVIVEHVFVGHCGVYEVSACRMDDTFGLSGGTRRIEDEKRVLGVHAFRSARGVDSLDLPVVPDIPSGCPADFAASTSHDEDFVDKHMLACGDVDCLVRVVFERYRLAAANAFVAGNDERRLAVHDTAGEGFGREPPEYDRMHGSDPGAGEHRVCCLGDHRHIDGNPVAFLHAILLHDIRHAADMLVKFAVGDLAVDVGIVALENDRGPIPMLVEMAVDAIVGDVRFAVFEPLDRNVPGKRRVLHD